MKDKKSDVDRYTPPGYDSIFTGEIIYLDDRVMWLQYELVEIAEKEAKNEDTTRSPVG